MIPSDPVRSEPPQVRKVPREEEGPQSVVERQGTVSQYLLRRAQRRREKFLQRAEAFSLRKELARNAYLAGCIVFDGVVLPGTILLMPFPFGWIVTAVALVVALWAEYRFYRAHFILRAPEESVS